jgi:hypothetical protein
MQKQISKRLEALERIAEKEVFLSAFSCAIAYYLGGAKHLSEFPHAYARALGYQDVDEFCEGLVDLMRRPSASSVKPSGIRARALQAQRKLLGKFGNDLDRASPAALADAAYRIVRSLPEEWRAMIKSAHRESCESEAAVNELLKDLTEFAEQQACSPHQMARRRP